MAQKASGISAIAIKNWLLNGNKCSDWRQALVSRVGWVLI
jgi:hypothetical protein